MRDAHKYDQLTLFGHFALYQGDDVLTHFSYDKVKALLVYLLLHRQPINRAALAELLWPDQGLSSGRTNLRHALHCLRQSLGEDAEQVLNVSRQTIAFQLPASWQVDLHELQTLLEGPRDLATLNAVLTCYQGDLIEELQLANCSEFQRWLVQARNEWRQRVIRFAEHVLDNHQEVPDGLLETLVSRFSGYGPFHERLVKQLAEQKQMAAAHEQYNSYLQLLALSGQQPEPSFLQLASYWSDGHHDARVMSPQGAFSRALATDSKPLREDEIELRQLSVMAIRLRLQGDWQDRAATRNCLALQLELLRWLEQQCHHLGGFWLPGATGGLGLACFGTHGPAHQLAELVALYEHCRQTLPQESAKHWTGEGEPPQFELAAGLHSGRVVYLPERQLADPLGQVTQISLELMSVAEGSELVISQESSQHMPPALDLQPRLVSRVLASDGRVRQRALVLGQNEGGRDALPPSLVGRETSLRTLRDALARAGIGLRQSVLVRGASGMGKSALMVGFRQLELSRDAAICWQPTTRLSVLEPYGVARTLLSWYLKGAADLDALHTLQTDLDFNALSDEQQCLLEEALGVRSVQEVAQLTQNGEAVELVVMLLHRLIERQAATHTLVLMVDDLQWLDEPSFKVLSGLQARLPINTAFMLVASHHGREPLPVKLHWDQQISLGRLDALQSSRLLSQLSRRYRIHLSPRLRNQIIERCDGVPLYMQEICRRLDMDRREGRSVQFDELPKGLLGLLASRIDQLEADRNIAHIAAVLGKRFRLDFLRECSGYDTTRLQKAMDHMRQLEIIEPVDNGSSSEVEFQFSHQLLQEAAYLSCPRDVRVTLHQQVVSLIEERFPMWISRHPGDFATHLRRSGHYARGARYFELAAREALKVSANRTALRMADFGLASLRHVEHEVEREVSLLTVRGQAAFALEGHGSPTAHESFVRARELLRHSGADALEDPEDLEQIFLVKWGLWVGRSQRYAHADAFALASTLADIAARLDDPRYQRLADYARAHCEYWAGRIPQAHDHLNEIDPLNAPMMIEWLPFSDHPQVTAACFQGWALCLRGDYQRAERQVSAAIRLAEKLGHPGTLAMALLFAASLYRQLGHVHLAARHAEKAAAMTATPDLQLWQISAQGILGWQRALAGDHGGLAQLRDSLDQMAELNGRDRFQRPVLWYSDACIALGELRAAEDYLDQCLVIAKERTTLFLPELATQLARVRIMLDHPANEVRALAEMAISQAREHGNRHQELAALELWLTRIAPDDEPARQAFHRLLGDVSHSDAPVLVRWVSLLDHRLASPERLES
ncbi:MULTISPECIES: AAA family ATPase [unclassified Halomonas]|uniref:AAA family ATPase n=1 Tax=unclassified Halomonas TaxID=2609666 RepID=UPI0006DA1B36|nr:MULTISPECIES: AAA family ATPase [unclassified Halomonas]KPQ22051.1 MAG: AAA ATPase domain [Halomonas sp. HL-93]SBR48538.1 AAA ATPase domain-containing protein [Halomonas sp. HL-93]SNY96238.1 AAA ATPase domain-containing protein [Halomonas sp. hl-4]